MVVEEVIKTLKQKVPQALKKENPPSFPPKPIIVRDGERIEMEKITIESDDPNTFSVFEEADDEVEKEVQERGTDTLAWYQPFHFYDRWGIYIRLRGIVYLVNRLARTPAGVRPSEANLGAIFGVAWETLRFHEFFHFLSEWGASFLEIYSQKPLYKNYAKLALSEEYKHNTLYMEEALANALAYRQLPRWARKGIASFFSQLPDGYANFKSYVENRKFAFGKRKLGEFIAYPNINELSYRKLSGEEGQFELLFDEYYAPILFPEIPTYIVREPEHKSSLLHLVRCYRNAKIKAYPGDHPPPHIHVWIPPESRREWKLSYPSLQPCKGWPPLPKKKLRIVEEYISKDKEKFDKHFESFDKTKPC